MPADVKYRDHNQPRQLFLDSIVEFYEKLGNRAFWADTERQQNALEALMQDYIRTNHDGHIEEDKIMLEAATDEYHLRYKYMLKSTSPNTL